MASTYKSLMPSKYPQLIARCLDNGSFDPIQCFGDKCVCVNSIYGGTVENQLYDSDKLDKMPCCKYMGFFGPVKFRKIKIWSCVFVKMIVRFTEALRCMNMNVRKL